MLRQAQRLKPKPPVDPDYPRAGERFVVKAQVSLATTGTIRQILIYDQRRRYTFEFPITKPWAQVMGNLKKAFFSVKFVPDREAGKHKYKMAILARVVDRNW